MYRRTEYLLTVNVIEILMDSDSVGCDTTTEDYSNAKNRYQDLLGLL